MNCIINGKVIALPKNLEKLSGYSFKSGLAHTDVDFKTKIRSITDLIIICTSLGLTEKEIAKFANIDVISITGKVKLVNIKSSSKDRFFELKNKDVVLTDIGNQRLKEAFGE